MPRNHSQTSENEISDPMIGRRIGVFELKKAIGRGGMGTVYLAERADGEFDQSVAVKLIRRGMDSDLILKRFRRERQILAALNHPNIAYFYGGGSTADGLPYFVMEYIEGRRIYQFCDENKLNITERLEIFRQVCEAVEAAHQIQVIHRDIKPSNILVKADGKVKLLDFGIAKVLDAELDAGENEPTATQMRVLTPEYASPEQVCGEPVTAASDIYSLGVVLYELLTGHRPYRLKRQVPHEVSRVICEEEPMRPSESLRRGAEEHKRKGEKYFNEPEVVSSSPLVLFSPSQLEGDLDKIILKTLRKNADERYQTAAALAEDIVNFLENRPVKAEAFAPERKISKQAKIEKDSIAILPFKIFGAKSAGETGDEFLGIGLADALVSRLSGIQRLIVRPTSSVLRFGENTDPFFAGGELGVDYVVEGNIRRFGDTLRVSVQLLSVNENDTLWAGKFDEKFTDVLSLEDSISNKIGETLLPHLSGKERRQLQKRGTDNAEAYEFYLRGRYFWNQLTVEGLARSIECYKRAIEIAPDYALAYTGIAEYYNFLGIYAVAPFAETSAASKKAALQAISIDETSAEAYAALAVAVFMGEFDWDATEKYLKKSISLNPNYALARIWYCYHLAMRGNFEEAFSQINRALEFDPLTPYVGQTFSWTLFHAGRAGEAIAATRRLLAREPNYALSHFFLSSVLWRERQYDEAIKIAKRGIELLGRIPYSLCWLASAYAAAGEREKALALVEEIERMSVSRYVSPYLTAMIYSNLDERETAFAYLEKALEIRDGRLAWLAIDPQFDVLHEDARFQEILRRTNNPLYIREAKAKKHQPVIAVLPLKSLSYGQDLHTGDQFLGIGLADALITRLTNIKRIVVRPTSSVLRYSEETTDPFQAGRELNVEFVLDGNFRRVGERVRISMQLLNVKENTSRWAQTFDENFTDVLELEDSISEKVSQSLVSSLTGEEQKQLAKRGTNNVEAFKAYMRGRYFWNQFTPESLPKALESFQKAVALDSNYALAYIGVADFYNWACIYGMIPPSECYPKLEENLRRALEIDDRLGEAYSELGLTDSNQWNFAEAEKNHRRAIELSPNYSLAHEWLSSLLVSTGRFEEGIREIKIAEQLDPLSLRAKTLTAWTFYQVRRFEDSLEKAQEIIELDKNYPQGYLQSANALIELGRAEEAVEAAQKAVEMMPGAALVIYVLCFALSAAGRVEEARKYLTQIENLASKTYVKPYFLAMSYLAVGDVDAAFEHFRTSFDEKDMWLVWFGTEPKLDSIRTDARFLELFRQTNNPILKRLGK
ncbi:MAG TPA: protein kinase [Pyrinomonadaceae bacterium]|jgi:serine/threonine protein kinase/tetratricopeptide (TPR) repeat protein